jgi:mono/diheme cytochrome c family protein
MRCPSPRYFTVALAALALATVTTSEEGVGQTPSSPGPGALLQVPVSSIFPGGVTFPPQIKNPAAGDPAAIERGMQAFQSMNCVGCHAPNGGGGMGPALSERQFIYGHEPANIYLSIYQGRPNGMPAWGEMLPADAIWDLVASSRASVAHRGNDFAVAAFAQHSAGPRRTGDDHGALGANPTLREWAQAIVKAEAWICWKLPFATHDLSNHDWRQAHL